MSDSLVPALALGVVCWLLQCAAALPWLLLFFPELFPGRGVAPVTGRTSTPSKASDFWMTSAAVLILPGLVLGGVLVSGVFGPETLSGLGRVFCSLLILQLGLDLIVGVFALMLMFWPKGAAVALAAFREGVRQPLFWAVSGFFSLLLAVSPIVPYFTFGQDHLLLKELGFDAVMLGAALFTVLAASTSISEEIEGRTAVTLMSKPVSRRQFLIGKFVGILFAGAVMTILVGTFFQWVLLYKDWFDRVRAFDPSSPDAPPVWLTGGLEKLAWLGEPSLDLLRGAGLWLEEAADVLPALVLGFCQAMVLLAVAVALATRVPMILNLAVCLVLYFLGHLTPALVDVSKPRAGDDPATIPVFKKMVSFVAQVFDSVVPGLELFTHKATIVSETPPPLGQLLVYVGQVTGYAVLYTAGILFFGLILFEDRDLA